MLSLLGLSSFMFGLVTAIAGQISVLDPANRRGEVNGYVYASDGHTILAVLRGRENRTIVPSDQISPWMKYAIVSVEDKRFWQHRGIDVHGMARAFWADVTNQGVVQGGSTITQQFVKNAYVSNQRSIARKLREAALAWQLEQRWSKDHILTAYLNTIYFANNAYGVDQASKIYFAHPAKDLTVPEAALLAGIPQDPSAYDPVTHPRAARARRNLVLRDMLEQHYLTSDQYRTALAQTLPRPQDVHQPGTRGQAPYFGNYVIDQLIKHYGSPSKVYGRGLRVKTTIDLGLQKIARDSVPKVLTNPYGPTAALVAIDPRTGAVLAMVGGQNFHESQFNLATQGERQPGSSFKPFVLATALREGIAPSTVFVSHPVQIPLGDRVWVVNNYEGEYLGPITLETATAFSDNSVFAQLTALVQPRNIVKTARDLGIQSQLKSYFAIGLGAEAVNPLEMARAYSAFANGGFRIDGGGFGNRPRVVDWIKNAHGKVVDDNGAKPVPVLTNAQAAIVNQLLQKVVQIGTGKQAALPDRPVAGKTGTTENYGDAWFVGYTPQLVAAVWVGYPATLRPMLTEYHGKAVAGGTFPALIWKTFMEQALPYLHDAPESFPSPPGLYAAPARVTVRNGQIELDNGLCHVSHEVVFFSGEAPTKTARCKLNEVEVPHLIGQTLVAARARLLAQPLTPAYVYKPATASQRLGIVLGQFPSTGTLSSYDKVTLVLAKPLHGVVPNLVGWRLKQAKARLKRLHLDVSVTGKGGHVVSQSPRGRVAAAPGMRVQLVAG